MSQPPEKQTSRETIGDGRIQHPRVPKSGTTLDQTCWRPFPKERISERISFFLSHPRGKCQERKVHILGDPRHPGQTQTPQKCGCFQNLLNTTPTSPWSFYFNQRDAKRIKTPQDPSPEFHAGCPGAPGAPRSMRPGAGQLGSRGP